MKKNPATCTRILVFAIAATLALALARCGGSSSQGSGKATGSGESEKEPEKDAIAVRTGAVEPGAIASRYSTSATLRADKRATVTARTRGVIRHLLVEEGDWVKAGAPLAVLDNDEQRIAHERSLTARDNKAREYERALKLFDQGLLAEEGFDAVRKEAEEARHSAELTALTLSRTTIHAPFEGRILTRHLDAGATVADGTAVVDLADLDPLFVDVNVPERHVARLSPSQTVQLTADATGEVVEGRIDRIAPLVDPETGTVKVTLAVSGKTSLRPGSFVRVAITTDVHHDALVAPRSALVAEGRRWHLYRLKPDGKHVEEVEAALGYEDRDSVEIINVPQETEPIRPGDRIVVVGASALSDNALVEVMDEETGQAGEAK